MQPRELIEAVLAGEDPARLVRKGDVDSDQLARGIEVEKEHLATIQWLKDNPDATVEQGVERIARDHLNEIPDYYTRLDDMESKAGVGH